MLSISYDLDSLLEAMSERNASVRLGLMHILEVSIFLVILFHIDRSKLDSAEIGFIILVEP